MHNGNMQTEKQGRDTKETEHLESRGGGKELFDEWRRPILSELYMCQGNKILLSNSPIGFAYILHTLLFLLLLGGMCLVRVIHMYHRKATCLSIQLNHQTKHTLPHSLHERTREITHSAI